MTSQIIVKFRDPKFDPSRAPFLHALSDQAGVELTYVRPMSGDAHVFLVRGTPDRAAIEQAVRRIAARPDVEYAEPDMIMQHQGGAPGTAR